MVELLQGIYDLMMAKFVERQQEGAGFTKALVPTAHAEVRKAADSSDRYQVTLSARGDTHAIGKVHPRGQLRSIDNERRTYIDWSETPGCTCTCGDVYQMGLPCRHVVALVRAVGKSSELLKYV